MYDSMNLSKQVASTWSRVVTFSVILKWVILPVILSILRKLREFYFQGSFGFKNFFHQKADENAFIEVVDNEYSIIFKKEKICAKTKNFWRKILKISEKS